MKFVGTPEVLERFVTLEQELAQIKTSAKSNGSTNAESMSLPLLTSLLHELNTTIANTLNRIIV